MKLQEKIALVTGAGSGIGQAIALLFAREGARVIATDMSAEGLQKTQRGLAELDLMVEAIQLDVTDEAMVKTVVNQILERTGRVDLLLNIVPAVRKATDETLIIANGFSCQEQIAQSTNHQPLHLAQVIQLALQKRR